jgi:hypothetical protein
VIRTVTNGSRLPAAKASAAPAKTGTTAAPSVRGRAARIHGFIADDGTWAGCGGQSFAVKRSEIAAFVQRREDCDRTAPNSLELLTMQRDWGG